MFFYGTLKSYAEPWLEKVLALITEQILEENRALTTRLEQLEKSVVVDFGTADQSLQELQSRINSMGKAYLEASQHAYGQNTQYLHMLQSRLENTVEHTRAMGADLSRLQQRLVNMEQNVINMEAQLPLNRETREEAIEGVVKTNADISREMEKMKESLAMVTKQQNALDEKFGNGPMLTMVDRVGQIAVRLTALEGALNKDKLERENSKLKKKGFLQLSR